MLFAWWLFDPTKSDSRVWPWFCWSSRIQIVSLNPRWIFSDQSKIQVNNHAARSENAELSILYIFDSADNILQSRLLVSSRRRAQGLLKFWVIFEVRDQKLKWRPSNDSGRRPLQLQISFEMVATSCRVLPTKWLSIKELAYFWRFLAHVSLSTHRLPILHPHGVSQRMS